MNQIKWESDTIASLRGELEMSREQFAVALGTTLQSVTRWERGSGRPGTMACKLLSYLAQSHTEGECAGPIEKPASAIGAVEGLVLEHVLVELREIKDILHAQAEKRRE